MTYTELTLAIEDVSLRADLDNARLVEFGQRYMEDILRLPEMEHTPDETVYLASGSNNIALLSDYLELKHIAFTDQLRSPINSTFTVGAGSLSAATYYYRVSAINANGETPPSTETSIVLAATGGVNVNWTKITGATGYKIYGRTTGVEQLIATVGDVATYLDGGTISPSGAMPTRNTTGSYRYPMLDRFPNEWENKFADNVRQLNDTGRPEYYERRGGYLFFDKTADKDYAYDMRYYRRLTPLSPSAPTNYFSTEMPEAFLYACLVKAIPMLGGDPRGTEWRNVFNEAIAIKKGNTSKESSSGRADRRGDRKRYY